MRDILGTTFRTILACLLVGSTGVAVAGDAREPIDVAALGPQVGERVPDFSLTDQNGKAWSRDSLLGPKGALLLFHRSADW